MNKHIVMVAAILGAWAAPVEAANLRPGLVVCIGTEALESVAADWAAPGYVFQCLERSEARVAALRGKVRAAGCYGKVSVVRFDGRHLPYVDNLADAVLVRDPQCEVPAEQIRRVLAPYGEAVAPAGAACLPAPATPIRGGLARYRKPYPEAMDEWPQYLHGADNNCVAQDEVVGPPRHVQWVSGPPWTRAHIGAATVSSMVSSGGRLFTIEDRETAENPLLPAKWTLVARSAFSGVELWTMAYPSWEQLTVYIKNYHAQMQRRLAAIGDTVYCTPGLNAPLTALDAATGRVLKRYEGTERTQEFVYHQGRLYAVVGDRMWFDAYRGAAAVRKRRGGLRKGGRTAPAEPAAGGGEAAPLAFGGAGFPLDAYNPQTPNAENPTCAIVAIDAASGQRLWRSGDIVKYTGCSMALKGDRLVYQSAAGVFCLDARTGQPIWTVRKNLPYGRGDAPNTLVLTDEAVYSEEGPLVFAYSLEDGRDLWGKGIPARKGYQASTDILIAAGALWMCGSCNNPKGVVLKKPTAYDLKTGSELRVLPQVLSKPMGHDRCFRNFITKRFFINSKTGGPDCLDLLTGAEYPAPFTRGTCSMGPLPCNGLIYCGPYACQCHLPVALHNFNAYYTDEASLKTKGQVVDVERAVRLEKGPAYGQVAEGGDAPWPTYRGDARRYGATAERVEPAGLKRIWRTRLAAPVTAPVVAEGKIFVAETDAHTLHALDADTGEPLWEYTAGGRIDSPPTYYKGLLLMGCRDGWAHCLRAADGALCWRFRDLPDKRICVYDQPESAWPVHGSILVANDTAYFCAGRSSYLDGGLFIYALDPVTGAVRHRRRFYGPYGEDGFPKFVEKGDRSETEVILGTTADVMTSDGGKLYIRHQAFHADLSDAQPGMHLLASAGLLEARRHHREYTLVKENFNHRKTWTSENTEYPTGDLIVGDGVDFYSVFGMPVTRGDVFNPRNGYLVIARRRSGDGWARKWAVRMPMTGKAMVLAGDTLFVAGAPLVFPREDLGAAYAGRLGGVLWALSAADGSQLARCKLDVLPAWDGMAAGYGRLYVSNQDGGVDCWAPASP